MKQKTLGVASVDFRPLRFSSVLFEESWLEIIFWPPNDVSRRFFVTKRLADFLVSVAACAHCGADLSPSLNACQCNHRKELSVVIPKDATDEFEKIFRSVKAATKSRRRSEMLKENGGRATRDEMRELWRIQEGLCYYCAKTLDSDSEKPAFHIDHYEAIADGGGGGIDNLVYACEVCNLEKGDVFGGDFRVRKKKNLSYEQKIIAGRIQKKHKKWLDGN